MVVTKQQSCINSGTILHVQYLVVIHQTVMHPEGGFLHGVCYANAYVVSSPYPLLVFHFFLRGR